MSDNIEEEKDEASGKEWIRAVAYSAVVVVAGFTYYFAQTAIEKHRIELPIIQYLDCLQTYAAYDWDRVPGDHPSGSAVCGSLSDREEVED